MKRQMKKAVVLAVTTSSTLAVRASSSADVVAAANRVSVLMIVFGTVFALGVAVVIALIIRRSR